MRLGWTVTGIAVAIAAIAGGGDERFPSEGNPVPTGVSADPQYGVTQQRPVMVGSRGSGPKAERDYLSTLRGPHGERVEFRRLGSCCQFKSPNGFVGIGLLDQFEVTYPGQPRPTTLYLNMYDYQQPLAPSGFTLEKR